MARKDDDGFPVGNQDPNARGRNRPRPERESGDGSKRDDLSRRPRGGKPGYGDVTDEGKQDR